MLRHLTNNYRKMHHLPKFRRYKNHRPGMMERMLIQMIEVDAFGPFTSFYLSHKEEVEKQLIGGVNVLRT